MDIERMRREYQAEPLRKEQLDSDPLEQFKTWFNKAREAGVLEPNAMVLATVNFEGKPSTRTVLLKQCDMKGFVFYTNFNSRKGQELTHNRFVALTFLWLPQGRQVSVQGVVEYVSREESGEYFKMRPREAQLSAWASPQSFPVENRDTLEKTYHKLEASYVNKEVPLPPFWGGYRVVPSTIEFWQGSQYRLHDRFMYTKEDTKEDTEKGVKWRLQRLAP